MCMTQSCTCTHTEREEQIRKVMEGVVLPESATPRT